MQFFAPHDSMYNLPSAIIFNKWTLVCKLLLFVSLYEGPRT